MCFRFSCSTEHLILNEQVSTVHNIRSHKIQTQLNLIHSEVFPELQHYTSKVNMFRWIRQHQLRVWNMTSTAGVTYNDSKCSWRRCAGYSFVYLFIYLFVCRRLRLRCMCPTSERSVCSSSSSDPKQSGSGESLSPIKLI